MINTGLKKNRMNKYKRYRFIDAGFNELFVDWCFFESVRELNHPKRYSETVAVNKDSRIL